MNVVSQRDSTDYAPLKGMNIWASHDGLFETLFFLTPLYPDG